MKAGLSSWDFSPQKAVILVIFIDIGYMAFKLAGLQLYFFCIRLYYVV